MGISLATGKGDKTVVEKCQLKDDQIYLIDGKNRTKKAIHSGWAHDFEWLEVEIRK